MMICSPRNQILFLRLNCYATPSFPAYGHVTSTRAKRRPLSDVTSSSNAQWMHCLVVIRYAARIGPSMRCIRESMSRGKVQRLSSAESSESRIQPVHFFSSQTTLNWPPFLVPSSSTTVMACIPWRTLWGCTPSAHYWCCACGSQ